MREWVKSSLKFNVAINSNDYSKYVPVVLWKSVKIKHIVYVRWQKMSTVKVEKMILNIYPELVRTKTRGFNDTLKTVGAMTKV